MPATADVPSITIFLFNALMLVHKEMTGHDPTKNIPPDCEICVNLNMAFKLINDEFFPDEDLEAWWPMDEESGDRRDMGPTEYPLVESSAVASIEGNVYPLALFFENGAGLLEADPAPNPGTGDFTIVLWIMPITQVSLAAAIFRKGSSSNAFVLISPTGTDGSELAAGIGLEVTVGDGTNVASIDTSTDPLLLRYDQWSMVRVEMDRTADELRLYVNEVLIATEDMSAVGDITNNAEPLEIGNYGVQAGHMRLGPVAMWSRLLAVQEGAYLLNGGLGRRYEPLAAP